MKQRRQVTRYHHPRWRFSLGDLSMRRSTPPPHRTIVVQLKLTDAARAVEAALPILDELSREIELLQQRQQIAQLQPSAQITLRFCFRGSDAATATIAQAINNSAYQLEELRNAKLITDFAVEYEILHSKHSRRQHSANF
ncbi:MAG: hypothetical protein N4J56_007145 [Chroococcidiopsis sp. SAG 2025]|uniref:hypothetical protein n=1 Tax=Chroococcidiopsis sp. SAG 2025 TaxID=171389 RepID=UPI00293738D8|nr:hypothetical protein [Chroococcidiopsis sp. SAG 2025]MDV2997440.1 hypothetical protein [Chroococcidiopsis sp. SAG 2025]